jgi:hypothetical protein
MAIEDDIYALLQTVDGKIDALQADVTAIKAKTDNLPANTSTVLTNIPGLVWDELVASHTTVSTFGKLAPSIPGLVWDELLASHVTASTFGVKTQGIPGLVWDELLSNHVVSKTFGFAFGLGEARCFLNTAGGRVFLVHAKPGSTIYGRLQRRADNYEFDYVTGTFLNSVNYFPLTEDATSKGLFLYTETRFTWNNGDYILTAYNQVAGAPAPANDSLVGITTLHLPWVNTDLLDADITTHTTTDTMGALLNYIRDYGGFKPQVGI